MEYLKTFLHIALSKAEGLQITNQEQLAEYLYLEIKPIIDDLVVSAKIDGKMEKLNEFLKHLEDERKKWDKSEEADSGTEASN